MNTLQHVGAFVVQFRSDGIVGGGPLAGRLEHVASGRTAIFHSRDGLLEALDQMVSEVRSALQRDHQQDQPSTNLQPKAKE
jgi:hypothetical protein